ncbi:MJ0042-type zinc finger domain-containing protein, partial [Pseudomonas sp. UBA5568]
MTDSFVTQCPHCQTSFRVTHHQLSVARGVVRCGQCLQVFNAAKQLLEQNR